MKQLKELLSEFENNLKEQHAPILSKLSPGISLEKIENIFKQNGIENNSLKELYHWRDGISYNSGWTVGELDFFSFGILMSLEDMIKHQSILSIPTGMQNKLLLPVFATGGGDYILFNVDNNSKDYNRLLLYAPMLVLSKTPMPIYDTLESFFETINECYEAGAYKFNETGKLDIDYELEQEISKRLNSASEYWN